MDNARARVPGGEFCQAVAFYAQGGSMGEFSRAAQYQCGELAALKFKTPALAARVR